MEKNEELRLAWEYVENTGTNIFLTGKAGTGKTTFLRELWQRSPKRMIVLAPTGIAAINAGGVTIHSFFQLPLAPYVPGSTYKSTSKQFKLSKSKRDIIRTLDLLVIDEISMVRADLLDAVDSVLRQWRVHHLPFGGVQLLLIGDLQQLAPVVTEADRLLLDRYYDTPYFFSSKALQSVPYQTIELQHVYRQQDRQFVELLNRIRENHADNATLRALNSRYIPDFKPSAENRYIRLTTHNYQATQINNAELERLQGKPFTLEATVKGDFPESLYPADKSLTLKVGAQVMFIKNDKTKQYYNGMLGEIASYDNDRLQVRSHDTGELVELMPEVWDNSKYDLDPKTNEITERVEGTFTQFPLRLAYAVTIHKSQGLTFDRAIIDASCAFSHGQTYVALSRCKTLEGIILSSPLTSNAIIADGVVDSFNLEAQKNKPTEASLEVMKLHYVIHLLGEMFSLSELLQAVEQSLRVIKEYSLAQSAVLIQDYDNAIQAIKQLTEVATKFATQYTAILRADSDVGNPVLQERIHSAAGYFCKQITPLIQIINSTPTEISNKETRERLRVRIQALAEEYLLKTKLYTYYLAADHQFTTGGYLRLKAHILLGDIPDSGEKAKTEKEMPNQPMPQEQRTKRKKDDTPSHLVSLGMLKSGMNIKEICAERLFAATTVYRHLERCLSDGLLKITDFIPLDTIQKVEEYSAKHTTDFDYQAAKRTLGNSISMTEMAIIRRAMNRKAQNKEKEE